MQTPHLNIFYYLIWQYVAQAEIRDGDGRIAYARVHPEQVVKPVLPLFNFDLPSCKHHAIEVIERLYPFAVSRVFAPGSVVFQYRVP